MIQAVMFLVIALGVGGYLFWLKKSGKLGAMQAAYAEAQEEVTRTFGERFEHLKNDPQNLRRIKDAIGGDFSSMVSCNKPRSLGGAAMASVGRILSPIVVTDNDHHLLVLSADALYYIAYDTGGNSVTKLERFELNAMEGLDLRKGTLTDNLKQAASVKTNSGIVDDGQKNSECQRVSFAYEGVKHAYFGHARAAFGTALSSTESVLSESVDEKVAVLMATKIADKFYDELGRRAA